MKEPRFTTVIDASGPNGYLMTILGAATVLMKQLNVDPLDIYTMRERVMDAKSYAEALAVIREWFPVDTGDGHA